MEKLIINKGYKEYAINDDETAVIRVKTTDFSLIDRLNSVKERVAGITAELEKLKKDADDKTILAALKDADCKVRHELDEVFASPVSDIVFEEMNCLSFAGGQPVALNFLEAIIPEITKDLNAEQKAATAKISKYTDAARQYK